MRSALVILNCLLWASCGYIGDPLPPALNVPATVADLRATQIGPEIRVNFTVPALAADGVVLERLQGVELRAGTIPPGDFRPEVWSQTAAAIPVSLEKPGEASVSAKIRPEWIGKEIVLAVRAVGPKGKAASWSNLVVLAVESPLDRPEIAGLDNVGEGVRVRVRHAAAYRVYRGAGDQAPVLLAEAEGPEYVDRTTQYGIAYLYAVQATKGAALSDMSESARITPMDVFPPAVPGNPGAVAGVSSIDVSWDPSADADLSGYRVYRSVDGGAWQAVATVRTPTYTDRAVAAGRRYRYQVTAVDRAGNESPRSPAVEAAL
ncbi:MAG: fibronectin type III domain-containing protein [Bryobacteraceae bacterium]|nr:fibronectin type III domain-containing protein [Bryobacteraceae bacterium]